MLPFQFTILLMAVMRKVAILNPNSTQSMTDSMTKRAIEVLSPFHVDVQGITNAEGPPAIQGEQDGLDAIQGMKRLLPSLEADVLIIGCFDDVGLEEIRSKTPFPVIGLGQAAYLYAALIGARFSVVTTVHNAVPVIEHNLRRQGVTNCAKVRATGIPVLELEEQASETVDRLVREIQMAETEDDVQAIVLGCAGMGPLRPKLSQSTNLMLIDVAQAAASLALALIPP